MKFIIGGSAQGKTDFARTHLKVEDKDIVNNLQLLIREFMIKEINARDQIEEMIKINPNTVFIGNEVGCGIVPLEPFEREYRDMVGEIYCAIAKDATHVYRVICGIGTCIKGG